MASDRQLCYFYVTGVAMYDAIAKISHSLLMSVPDGIIVADQDDAIMFINNAAEAIRGIKAENFIGRSILSIHAPSSSARIMALLNGLKDGSIPESRRVIQVKNSFFENSYYPIRDDQGAYRGTVLVSRDVTDRQILQNENQALRQGGGCGAFSGFVSISAAMTPVFQTIGAVAPLESTVLITGESGTGKELVAAAIHRNSLRKDRPMVTVNCAALPEHLVESELFGHQRGAFTGAVAHHPGKCEQAHHSTLFLDEIGDLPMNAQAKLLRVLQERTICRLGSTSDRAVDVRFIAATNRDLKQMVADGTFREDLYYRLHVITLHIPPLRERREDILAMAEFFVKRFCGRMDRPMLGICEASRAILTSYAFPGNVRELEHAMERAVALCQGACIAPGDLPEAFIAGRSTYVSYGGGMAGSETAGVSTSLVNCREEAERHMIQEALRTTGGRKAEAARLLGISRKTLWEKLKHRDVTI